jgi:hypothetical protein
MLSRLDQEKDPILKVLQQDDWKLRFQYHKCTVMNYPVYTKDIWARPGINRPINVNPQ